MDVINPTRKELDPALAAVLDSRRHQGGYWPWSLPGLGGDFFIFDLLILIGVFVAWLTRWLSVEPIARGRVCAIEQTSEGIDLIDQLGQRDSVPREALRLQVASLWEPRRLLILKTWARGPSRLTRTVALGTVDWIPIRGDVTVREWEEFLGVKVDPEVTMNVA